MLCDVSYLNGLENPWLFHVSESLKIHVVEQFLECSGRCHGQAWLIYSFLQPMLCVWHYLSDSVTLGVKQCTEKLSVSPSLTIIPTF